MVANSRTNKAMNMHLILVALALLALALTTTAMPTDQKEWREAEAAAKNARALYTKIQAQKPVTTQEIPFDLKGDPMEGTITRYTFQDGLSAIALSYIAGDHGTRSEHFYFKDGKLFFILTKDNYWNFANPGADGQPTTKDTLVETRYYLNAEEHCLRALRRSATAGDGTKLPTLIAQQRNEVVDPNPRFPRLLEKGKGLFLVNRGAMASDFFESFYRQCGH